jgi:hypothetical protein
VEIDRTDDTHRVSAPMSTTPVRHRVRSAVCGVCLLAAPALGLAWSALVPPFTSGMAGEVAFIAAHPTRWWTATYAGVLFSYLMIPAVLGLLHLLDGRQRALARVGGALGLAGAAFHGGLLCFQLAETAVVLRVADDAHALALATALFEQPAFAAVLAPVAGLFPGLVLLAVALWRAGAAPAWVPALVVAAALVELLGPPAIKARLFFVLLVAAFGPAGLVVLRGGTWRRPDRVPGDIPADPAGACSALTST